VTTAAAPDLDPADLDFLDWPALLARLGDLAQSSRGRQLCLSLPLCADRASAQSRMADVAEAAALLANGELLPSLTFPEIEAHLDAVEKGVPLSAEELKQVAAQCEVTVGVRRRFEQLDRSAGESGSRAPRLAEIVANLSAQEELVFHARDTFDASGELRDSASPELFRLRRERDQMAARPSARCTRRNTRRICKTNTSPCARTASFCLCAPRSNRWASASCTTRRDRAKPCSSNPLASSS
jgi:dsDNA-specific endonuclease/ATPase MutS2